MVVPSQQVVNSSIRSGFRRYLMSIQYHGSSFLGFQIQPTNAENCVLPNGTDVRGYVSVERRIRLALTAMLNDNLDFKNIDGAIDDTPPGVNTVQFENIQVSSRTDRGVHAIKNTFHVDIRVEDDASEATDTNKNHAELNCLESGQRRRRKHLLQSTERMLRGINYFLRRTNLTTPTIGLDDPLEYDGSDMYNDHVFPCSIPSTANNHKFLKRPNVDTQYYCGGEWVRRCPADEVRILAVKEAPLYMQNSTVGLEVYKQDEIIDWNARYSAKSRTYVYRIMYCRNECDWGIPFEWDRSWRIYDTNSQSPPTMMNIDDMRLAASYLVGTHDFSAFRASGCVRPTPIMTMSDITVHVEPYDTFERLLLFGSLSTTSTSSAMQDEKTNSKCFIITIRYKGDKFLYRQVRKMTACLVAVGRGKMTPTRLRDILMQKNAAHASFSAPPQGLYLVDVEHEGIHI